jgi:hypothetical protein
MSRQIPRIVEKGAGQEARLLWACFSNYYKKLGSGWEGDEDPTEA